MCCCASCRFSQGIGLAVLGITLLVIGVGGAYGFIYWDKHGGAKATYWVGIAFIIIGCIGFCFLLLALALAIWACYKESRRHRSSSNAPAPAPPPPAPAPVVPQAMLQAPISHEIHHHHYPPQQPAYYSPPPANYYPPPDASAYPPRQSYDPTAYPPQRHGYGDPSSQLDSSVHV